MSESFEKWKAAAEKLTSEQKLKVIHLLYGLADGCSFAMSRPWRDPDCAKDNGHGYDCDHCAAVKILHELGLTTPMDDEKARYEERKRHEPPRKVKRGNRLPRRARP